MSPANSPAVNAWIDLIAAWIAFLILAYLPAVAPARAITPATLTLFWAFFSMTSIVLCDQIVLRLENRSLLLEMTANGKAWLRFAAIGALSGLLLDGIAQWLGKLWFYPDWNEFFYALSFIPGFMAYWIVIVESYLAVRAVVRRFRRPLKREPRVNKMFFRAAGIAGLALTAAGIVLLLDSYPAGYGFETRARCALDRPFLHFAITAMGVWLMLEYAQWACGRESLLMRLSAGDAAPLWSLLLASLIFSFFWESVNAQHHFWIYSNWPWERRTILGAPVAVIAAWPIQYLIFLSLGFLTPRELWR